MSSRLGSFSFARWAIIHSVHEQNLPPPLIDIGIVGAAGKMYSTFANRGWSFGSCVSKLCQPAGVSPSPWQKINAIRLFGLVVVVVLLLMVMERTVPFNVKEAATRRALDTTNRRSGNRMDEEDRQIPNILRVRSRFEFRPCPSIPNTSNTLADVCSCMIGNGLDNERPHHAVR